MVADYRRSRRNYPVLIRCYGRTIREDFNRRSCEKFAITCFLLWNLYRDDPIEQEQAIAYRNIALMCLIIRNTYVRWSVYNNPTFTFIPMGLADYSDDELHNEMRIMKRSYIPRLLLALQFPVILRCDNGTRIDGEYAFLMWIYWISKVRTLTTVQRKYGIEYSQISRILKCVWLFMSHTWSHLVTDNFAFFVRRLAMYNACFIKKYKSHNNVNVVPNHWKKVALFTDGTKQRVPKGKGPGALINYSGNFYVRYNSSNSHLHLNI